MSGASELEDSRRKRGSHGHGPGSPQTRPLPLPLRGRAELGPRLRQRWPLHLPRHRAGGPGGCGSVCTRVPLGASGCVQGAVRAHPGGGRPQERDPHPSPSRAGGQAHVGRGGGWGLPRRKPPARAACAPPLPETCQAQWSWQWPDLWGTVGGTQHPGPSRSWAVPQGPQISTRRKEGPVGVGAQG